MPKDETIASMPPLGQGVDRLTHAAIQMSSDHNAIHRAYGYVVSLIAAAVANGAATVVHLKTPVAETKLQVHLKVYKAYIGGGDGKLEVIERPTSFTPGTSLTPRNRQRSAGDHSAVVAKLNPTDIVGGTVLDPMEFGGGGIGSQAPGGGVVMDIELVLDAGTDYFFKFTNISGQVRNISPFLFWYEEPTTNLEF